MTLTPTTGLSPQELEARFDLLVADVREYALFLVSEEGNVRCWNPGAERLFGYSSPEIIGQHFSRLFSPEDVRSGQPEHELKTALERGASTSIRWQVRRDGTRFWSQMTTTPLFDENKQARSFGRVMHDLTEGQAQVAQKKRADDLAEANRSKEEFMALLSHELRNPLSPILSALDVQRHVKSDDPILRQAGDIIERQVGHMVRMVDDLLDISRITKGKLRLQKEPVELRVIVNRAAEAARPIIDCRKHEFSMSLPTEPIWVAADPTRLEQVVVNLLNNAAKYTDLGRGLIRLSLTSANGEAVIKVWDNGLGMLPEMLPRIFDLFTQVDCTLSRSHGGLGVGLALVRTLVEMHDGRVQAHSAGLNRGSEFTVILPAIATPPAEAKIVIAQPPSSGPSLRVLVVEDNVDAGDSLSLLLRLQGHECLLARTGPSALEMASAFHPQVVLLDIGLPGMDGYQVAQRMRGKVESKDALLCALTGYTPSDADVNRPQQAGFDHHFVKPVDLKKLFALLDATAATVSPPIVPARK